MNSTSFRKNIDQKKSMCFARNDELSLAGMFPEVGKGQLCVPSSRSVLCKSNVKGLLERTTKKHSGFTLVELVIAIAIFGIAVSAMMLTFRMTVSNSADPGVRMQAVVSAESIMDEVLNKYFTKPDAGFAGPYTLANRAQFDTVSDYNGLTMTGITNVNGDPLPGLENFNVSIGVTSVALGALAASNVQLVTVTVQGTTETFILKGYAINPS